MTPCRFDARSAELLGALLDAVKPTYAVVTSSDEEPESTATVEALDAAGVTLLLTREGAVTLHSDGKRIDVLREP